MDSALTEKALAAAVAQCQVLPEIFNTDQGSQFTSPEWTGRLESMGIAVSMDGKGRWMDNVFIERLWRSVKYEDIYLRAYATVGDLEIGLRRWIGRYNTWRPHQVLGNKTPAHVYETNRKPATQAIESEKAACPPSGTRFFYSSATGPRRPLRSEASRALRCRAKKSKPLARRSLTPSESTHRKLTTGAFHSLF